ncbi:MAG: histidine triad nucleotide-binding protein [Bacteroides sp.]|nr:histidine triad nucleotide-binding protein [Bacteroides sp.]
MENCLFCKITAGEIPSTKVYEDEDILAFKDINPMAPVHILIIPKAHIDGADMLNAENSAVVSKIFTAAAQLARELGLENGFRIVTNVGEDGGQTVRHLHFHLLGGQKLNTALA